jgi:hypothetical protein
MNDSAVVQPTGLYLESGATTDNVGIGVADPDATLEILDTTTQLKLSYDATNYATFNIAADGLLTITTVDPDGAEADIILAPDGNVGIGTDAPAGLMEISSTSGHAISYITAKADATYTPQIQFRTGATPSTKFSMGVEAVGHADAGKFKIASQSGMIGTSEFVIDSSGNVGIGTASPAVPMHINKTAPAGIAKADSFLHLGVAVGNSARATIGFGYSGGTNIPAAISYKNTNNGGSTTGELGFFTRSGTGDDAPTQVMTISSGGDVTVETGNLVIGTEGKGISFENAADVATGETVSSSLLDDYEEGYWTWTAVGTTSGSWTARGGYTQMEYTKVGRVVHVQGRIETTGSGSSPVGGIRISLPFTSASLGEFGGGSRVNMSFWAHGGTIAGTAFGYLVENSATFDLYYIADDGNMTQITNSVSDADWEAVISFSYISAA